MGDINEIFKQASSSVFGGNELNDFDRFNINHEFVKGPSSRELDTEGYMYIDRITITDKVTQESIEGTVDLLFVPSKTEVGYSINNSNKQVVSLYKRSPGWYISKNKEKDGKENVEANYVVNGRKIITLRFKRNSMTITRPKAKGDVATPLGVFLRAVTNYSYDEIINKIGNTSNGLLKYMTLESKDYGHLTIADCIDAAINVLDYRTRSESRDTTNNIYTLQRFISPYNKFKADEVNRSRLETMISFRERALNKALSRDVTFKVPKNDGSTELEEITLKKGIILTSDVLEKMDRSNITTLFVEYLGKTYELKKYPIGRNEKNARIFTPEEFFTIANMAINHLEGYPLEQDEYDVNNRLVEDIDGAVNTILENRLSEINLALDDAFVDFENDVNNTRISTVHVFNHIKSINTLELVERLRDTSSKEVQTSDIDNIIAYETKNCKIMINASGTSSDAMTKIQDLQVGRLDPSDQPESQKIGMVHVRAHLAKYDKHGQIVAPYLKVENGKIVSDKPVYITADQELNKYVAEWNETFENPKVKARYNGTVITVPRERINYMQYSPVQDMSLARAFVVFQNHNNAKRLQMSCNHMKQAEILYWGERPRVSTGYASISRMGIFTAEMLLEEYYEEAQFQVSKEDFIKQHISISNIALKGKMREIRFKIQETGEQFVKTIPFILPTGAKTIFMYRINNKPEVYQGLDIVLYNSGVSIEECDKLIKSDYGHLEIKDPDYTSSEAQGINLRVLYKTQDGSTVDDAIAISSAVVYSGMGTSPVISHLDYELKSSADGSFVESFAGNVDSCPHIGEDGLPAIGTYLKHGDVFMIVHKTKFEFPDGKSGSKEPTSVTDNPILKRIDNYVEGTVVHASVHGNKATVLLAHSAELEVGDKWSGRHGNKGVTSKIIPEDEMPYAPDGKPYHIILNPLGIPSRMNIGQVLEVCLGGAMSKADKYAVVSPYFPDGLNLVKEECEKYGVKPVRPIDGKTGLPFDREVLEGEIYMQKLVHRVSKKITARGLGGAKNAVTQQPIKGKGIGGQSIGEMETWILDNVGCKIFLQELMSVQSDDIKSKDVLLDVIKSNVLDVECPSISENRNDKTLQVLARMLCTEISYEDGEVSFNPLTDKVIESFSKPIEIKSDKDLQDGKKFGESFETKKGDYPVLKSKDMWYHINLNCEIVHPLWLYDKSPLYKLILVLNTAKALSDGTIKPDKLTKDMVNKILNRKGYVYKEEYDNFYRFTTNPSEANSFTGIEAICKLIRNIDLEVMKEHYSVDPKDFEKRNLSKKLELKQINQVIDSLQGNFNPEDYIITKFPIIPRPWRPKSPMENVVNDFDKRYTAIAKAAYDLKQSYSDNKVDQLYTEVRALIGISEVANARGDLQTVLKYFVNKDNGSMSGSSDDHGFLRGNVLSKRIDMSARTVIIPQRDINRRPTELGVPMYIICKIWATHLEYLLRVNGFTEQKNLELSDILLLFSTQDKYKIDSIFGKGSYTRFLEHIDNFLKTRVVVCGRQPSLHNSSIRAYIPYRSETKSIEIHPLVCSAYNADFDGDQMWVAAPISAEAQQEVWDKLSIYTGIISPKDSACLLDHNQDSLLGLYYGTMLYENVTSVVRNRKYFTDEVPMIGDSIDLANVTFEHVKYSIYDSLEAMELDLINGILDYQSLVLYQHTNGRNYMSTAGRVLLNNILPDSFTEFKFTNTLGIPMPEKVKADLYELKYDKLFCKSGKSQGIESQSIKKLNIELFENFSPEETIEYYHQLMVYGLKASHKSAISLPLSDIENYKYAPDHFEKAKIIEDEIIRDYENGIITEEEKKKSVISLYKSLAGIIKTRVMAAFPRNNNLFIMFDSGARGSEGQILQTVGIIGITSKTNTEELETPIATSYSQGLSCFDTFESSYSGRTSVKSTQNDTALAGYGTRQATYMTFGYCIVEDDCGKEIQPLEILYGNPNSIDIVSPNGEVVLKESFDPDVAVLKIMEILGNKKYSLSEEFETKYKSFIVGNNVITANGIKSLLKNKVRKLTLEDGSICTIKYEMEPMMKDLLLNREVVKSENLPYTKKVKFMTSETVKHIHDASRYDFTINTSYSHVHVGKRVPSNSDLPYLEEVEYITDKTVKYIEDKNLQFVRVRVLLDCHSDNGCCARCYGLKFENNELPLVGDNVGVIAAQSVGEPSTQLTMNMAHTGTSMANGVEFFTGLLQARETLLGFKDNKSTAILADYNGYVSIRHVGDSSIVSIYSKPNKARNRKRRNELALSEVSIPTKQLDILEGEYVEIGSPLSKGIISPDRYGSNKLGELTLPIKQLILKRMLLMLKLYFDVFYANKLKIHARHFEIFSRLQNQYLTGLVDIESSTFKDMTYSDILKMDDSELEGIQFLHKLASQEEVILKSSGPLTLSCFEQICRTFSKLSFSKYHGTERGMAGKLAIGQNLSDPDDRKQITHEFPGGSANVYTKRRSSDAVYHTVDVTDVLVEDIPQQAEINTEESIESNELLELLGVFGGTENDSEIDLSLDFMDESSSTNVDTVPQENAFENHISMSDNNEDDDLEDDDFNTNSSVGKLASF